MELSSRLPNSLRRVAISAACGSLGALITLKKMVVDQKSPYSLEFLPAFYANLDTSKIPDIHNLDEQILLPEVSAPLLNTVLSLKAIQATPDVPCGVYADLWPSFWGWAHFFYTYPYTNPDDRSSEQQMSFALELSSFTLHVGLDEHTRHLIYSTPGVRAFLGKMWAILLQERRPEMIHLVHFIGAPSAVSSPSNFDEFVEVRSYYYTEFPQQLPPARLPWERKHSELSSPPLNTPSPNFVPEAPNHAAQCGATQHRGFFCGRARSKRGKWGRM
ncbi:hypothetical protein C8R46DRAFT_1283505 [Mycena filopes]|nr:hypothetical protein C8R46DRAFT_1283505 [Mycena filopes]